MDKIAIISDIHGNKTALDAVLDDISKRKINKIICLGDLATKGANPDYTIDLIKKKCDVVLMGNCDEPIFSKRAIEMKYWVRKKIGDERAEYLSTLPVSYETYVSGHLIRFFHSSPFGLDYICNPAFSNKDTNYIDKEITDPLDLFKNTEFIGKTEKDPVPDIVGYGHLHTQNLYRIGNKTIFNPGSVGLPTEMRNINNLNDKTNKFSTVASYTIIEGELNSKEVGPISFNNVRIPYDISKEIEYLKNTDMPGKEKNIYILKTASIYF